MEQKTCPRCGHVDAAGAVSCSACGTAGGVGVGEQTVKINLDEDQRTMLMARGPKRVPPVVDGEVEEDQRTVLITGRPPRPPAPKPAVEDDDQGTVLINHRPPAIEPAVEDDDQRTVMVSPDLLRPTPPPPPPPPPAMGARSPSPQHWGAPPAGQPVPHQPPTPYQQPVHPQQPPLADGYPEELTTSLTGSLLGAKAAPPKQVPKTSYRMVIPILIIGLLVVIAVGAAFAMIAGGAAQDLFDSIISNG
jgi:hypothetical protein